MPQVQHAAGGDEPRKGAGPTLRRPDSGACEPGQHTNTISGADPNWAGSQRDALLAAILDGSPSVIMLVDQDLRVRQVNRAGAAFARRSASDMLGARAGEALGCLAALNDPRGCGFAPACEQCLIRATVSESLRTGHSRVGVRAAIPTARQGEPADVHLLLSTAPVVLAGQPMALVFLEDITPLTRVEQDLRESRQHFETLFEQAPLPYQSLDGEGRFIAVNQAWLDALGYRREEVLGRWFGDFLPPEFQAAFRERFPRFKAAGATHGTEFEVVRKDGSRILVSFEGRIGYDSLGRFKQTHCVFQDVTDRKRAEEALRSSEEKFRQIAETIREVFWVGSPDWREIDYISPAYEEVWGRSRQRLYDAPRSWLEAVHDDDRASVQAALEEKSRGTNTDPMFPEYRIVRPDGSVRWILARAYPVRDATGQVVRVAGIAEDVTEHRRAQQEYQTLFREMLNGFALHEVICDAEGRPVNYRFLAVNPAFERLTGLRAENLIGRTVLEVLPQTEKHWIETYGRVALSGVPVRFENHSAELQRHFDVTAFQPSPGQFACIFDDVTERKRAEQERRELEAQLRQAQKLEAVGQLAAGVAHDFNNLLAAIIGNAELMESAVARNPSAAQALERIREATTQAAGVTRSLLTFSRGTAARKERVELREIVERTMQLLRRMIPSKVIFTLDPPDQPSVWLFADGAQLQQVVMNLVINARDAMPDGGQLHVSVQGPTHIAAEATRREHGSDAPAGRVARLIVRDSGCGMTPAVQERVFEPFFTTKAREQGTGLGLAIVHGIVREHGGTIEIDSTPEKGTTFTITLPVADAEAPGAAAEKVRPQTLGGSELVLLAEDNASLRHIIATALRKHGFRVLEVADGPSVLRSFTENGDDLRLLVLDVDLPIRNGLDCLREMRRGGASQPAIIITGGVHAVIEDDTDRRTVLLQKPFSMAELRRRASELVADQGRRKAEASV